MPETLELPSALAAAGPASQNALAPLPLQGSRAADDEDEDDEPKRKKGPPAKKEDGEDSDKGGKKKGGEKKNLGMYIGIGVGALLLLSCCCCGGGGGGGWWVYTTYLSKPPFYGAWVGRENPFIIIGFDPGAKGYYVNVADMLKEGKKEPSKDPNCTWKMIDDKTVEITMNDAKKKLWQGVDESKATFTFVVAGNELTLTNTKDKKAYKFIKVDEKKKG